MAARTFTQYLLDLADDTGRGRDFAQVLSALAVSAKLSAADIGRGSLILSGPRRGPADLDGVNRALRRLVTRHLVEQTAGVDQLAAISLARNPAVTQVSPSGRYLLLFEALHGMKNLTDDLPAASVFSILERDPDEACTTTSFLQPGSRQVAAGMVVYGPRTVLVVTTGQGVHGFTLDLRVGNFVLTDPHMTIAPDSRVFAVDPADAPHWPPAVKRYVDECLAGSSGPRASEFTMRWNASVVVGAFRVLNRGGLFLIPATDKSDQWLAPLLHNAAPLAFLAEQAKGAASDGSQRILDLLPASITSRTPLFFGNAREVERLARYFRESEAEDQEEVLYPLFHNRSLFID